MSAQTKKIALLAAVDRNWGIGYQNRLLFQLKKDMAFFKEKTVHNIVVMGRKTQESLPGGNPLPDRKNIVLTRKNDLTHCHAGGGEDVMVMHSPEEVLAYVNDREEDVFIIGGGEIYRQFLAFATDAYITKVDAGRNADTFFPDLDQMPQWKMVSESETISDESGVEFRFVKYRQTVQDI